MAYIVPDSELQFFQNLNIDPDYENTIYFATTQEKDTFFDNQPSIKCPSCYYQREMRGSCRVEVPISRMLNRSYMRFRNKQFEDKWFYAFINDVEYINNITTQVNYTLDVMMTWMGSYTLDECFIERNHTITDDIGDNVVPESFDTSITVHNTIAKTNHFTSWDILTVFVGKYDNNWYPSAKKYGFFTGLHYDIRSSTNFFDWISSLSDEAQERIVGMYYVPHEFVPYNLVNPDTPPPISFTVTASKPVAGVTRLDGYTPKNNKLYTYPFYKLVVSNTEGEEKEFMFELSKSTNGMEFELRGIVGEATQIALIPVGYNTPASTGKNYTEAMSMTSFPMCGWNIDTYKAYLAQQMVALPSTLGNIGLAAVAGSGFGASGALVGGGTAFVASTVDFVSGAIKAYRKPLEYRGKDTPQLGLCVNAEYKDFYLYKDSVRGYQAKIIDDYFTMFGYAINEVRQPSINVRPYYTYVKTIGCHINGSIPASDQRAIEEVYNNGVRFWRGSAIASDPEHVHIGDYSLNNAPVAPTP